MFGFIKKELLDRLLGHLVENISDDLRKAIINMIKKLDEIAKSTPNPIDDFAVALLKAIVGIDD